MEKTLNLYFNKQSISSGFMSLGGILGILLLIYLGLKSIGWLIMPVKLILGGIASLLTLSLVWAVIAMNNNYAATLDRNGITLRGFGFINWKDIQNMYTYSVPNLPIEMIGIKLNPGVNLPKESSYMGRLRVYISKKMGNPEITLSGLTVDNKEVISFANQFIKQ